jgi:hypothetical protein
MKSTPIFAIVASLGAGVLAGSLLFPSHHQANAASINPSDGFTLHIDADKHYAAHPNERIHHWCKKLSKGLIECQLYTSDAPNAELVGVETIVSPELYATFSTSEKRFWHWHQYEVPRVNASMPDLSKDEAAKVVAQILPTYGKVYILWDPMTDPNPVGAPSVTILK